MENLKKKRNLIIKEAEKFYDLSKRKKKKIEWDKIFISAVSYVNRRYPELENLEVKFTEQSLKKYVYNLRKIKKAEKNEKPKLEFSNAFNENEKLLHSVKTVQRTYKENEEIVFINYINKNLYYSVRKEKMMDILEQVDLIIKTVVNLFPTNKNKRNMQIISWPNDVHINFSWKEFLKSYKTINENKFLSVEKKLSIQKDFFHFFKFRKVFSKKNNVCYNLVDLISYNWEISVTISITKNIENGLELLDETAKISLYFSPINEKKPWFKYTALFEKTIIKEKIRALNLRKLKSPITKVIQGVSNLLFEIQINSFGRNKFTYELMQISLEDLAILLGHYNTFGLSQLTLLKNYIMEMKDIFLKLNFGYILLPPLLNKKSIIFIEPNNEVINLPLLKNLEIWFITKRSKLFDLKYNFFIPDSVIYEKLQESIKKNKGIVSKFVISETFFT